MEKKREVKKFVKITVKDNNLSNVSCQGQYSCTNKTK